MIKAIFYSKFDIHEGPKVIHQVPNNSITGSSNLETDPLIPFSSLSSSIIPRQNLCGLPITLLSYPYRVLSHPICLSSSSYARNEFIFSFSLVLHHRTSTSAYLSVVKKLAALFKHLEETTNFLSRDGSRPNTGKIYALCEILLEDLNNYCEAMIPIDESNTLNIKLFPVYPPPPPLAPQHVPLATVRLSALTDSNWDLTMLRILPFIDGINSIRNIARLADADYKLVRKAIAHLVYYGCVTLLDVFSFGASYGPTSEMSGFVTDSDMQEEARRYMLMPDSGLGDKTQNEAFREVITGERLVELYCSLKQGLSLRNWCMENADIIGIVDVRRFITFGVIKGFLYRVHKYAIALSPDLGTKTEVRRSGGHGQTKAVRREGGKDAELGRFLDGTHCFDEICTELMISEKELLARLKTWGEVQVIQS